MTDVPVLQDGDVIHIAYATANSEAMNRLEDSYRILGVTVEWVGPASIVGFQILSVFRGNQARIPAVVKSAPSTASAFRDLYSETIQGPMVRQ